MNYYDVMMRIIVDYYILCNESEEKKKIYCAIITLDKDEPIILELDNIIGESIYNIKPLLKNIINMTYKNYHSRIFEFYDYYRINHDGKKDTAKSDLSYIHGLFEKDSKEIKEKDMLYITYSFPKYIKNWFQETDKRIMTEKNKDIRKELKQKLSDPIWVHGELDIALEYAINSFLNIYEKIDSDDDEE
jgi:hypothetical protein